jgi:translation initiation factor IF-2
VLSKDKVRIYDLAKSLVPESLPDKDRKNAQSKRTKQILDICEKLGYLDKTPSSSIESDLVSKVLTLINSDSPQDLDISTDSKNKKGENLKNTKTISATVEAHKKPRVLRRIITETVAAPEPTPIEESHENTIDTIEETVVEAPAITQEEKQIITPAVVVVEAPPKEPIQATIQFKPRDAESRQSRIAEHNQNVRRAQEQAAQNKIAQQQNQQAKPQQQTQQAPPQQQTQNTTQPYRVAKPINNTFATRRKPAAPPAGRRAPGKPSFQNKPTISPREKAASQETIKPTELVLTHAVTVKELAVLLNVQETEVIRNLFLKGVMRTVNQTLEVNLIQEVAADLGCIITIEQPKSDQSEDLASRLKELVDVHTVDESKDLVNRPPVVTIMGHVDHGKTTLLDSIRKVKLQITSTESGGITQHIGAYQIDVTDYDHKVRKVTFLDTPGHEAFTALRARGAQVTDIAILVVAADDGVMPQTIEAIAHAKAAGVPIIVAVNKIDKPDANPDRVLTQLIEHGLVVEDYGGPVVCSKISAKQNLNLNDLLTKITLVADAELGDKLLSNPSSLAVGAVIEAALSPSRGPVATLLIQSGTLKKGDAIAAGTSCGRVRAIFNDIGREIEEAPPATPVQILGLDTLPQAGDTFRVFKNLQESKAFATIAREKMMEQKRGSRGLEFFSSQVREGTAKELPVIIKADVQGSAEAIASELNKLSTDQVRVRIVHCAAGAVTENDVNLASATNSIIVNFHSVLESTATRIAAEQNVPIYTYNIIYQISDAIRKALGGLLEPERIEVKYGQVEIRQVFPSGKTKIAGCYVTEGKIVRGSIAKIIRNKKELVTLRLDSLKRFKDDAKEVLEGFECGIVFDGFNDFLEGDIIESWGVEFQERTI